MNDILAADRVADFIGVVKWVLIILGLIAGVIAVFSAIFGSASFMAVVGLCFGILFQLLLTWAVFGWFQHTLGMLVNVAANTTPATAVLDKHD